MFSLLWNTLKVSTQFGSHSHGIISGWNEVANCVCLFKDFFSRISNETHFHARALTWLDSLSLAPFWRLKCCNSSRETFIKKLCVYLFGLLIVFYLFNAFLSIQSRGGKSVEIKTHFNNILDGRKKFFIYEMWKHVDFITRCSRNCYSIDFAREFLQNFSSKNLNYSSSKKISATRRIKFP